MIRMSKVVRIMATVIAGVLLGTGTGVAAHAEAPCPDDSLCLYEHRDFGGHMIAFPAGSAVPSLNDYWCEFCVSSGFHPVPCPEL
jgi:hypothetical protein